MRKLLFKRRAKPRCPQRPVDHHAFFLGQNRGDGDHTGPGVDQRHVKIEANDEIHRAKLSQVVVEAALKFATGEAFSLKSARLPTK